MKFDRKSFLNALTRNVSGLFNGAFYRPELKHDHYKDFGFPQVLTFKDHYGLYLRSGLARAAVEKTILKTWQTQPYICEMQPEDRPEDGGETILEESLRVMFAKMRIWQKFADADRRSLVGKYAGLIFRFRDGRNMDQPVGRVPGGLAALFDVIPCWEDQLIVSEWDTDLRSEGYGNPKMYQFNEAAVNDKQQPRSFTVHPDRVFIWSRDGSVNGNSMLEAGYNSARNMEKVEGSGGEGFYKNARSNPVLTIGEDTDISGLAESLGVDEEEVAGELDKVVEGWLSGFDRALMLKGITAQSLPVTLPSPEHFYNIALQSFAASVPIPQKILVGSQTGERASTEDAREWAEVNMSRRNDVVIPNIMAIIDRWVKVGMLPEKDWHLTWASLLDATPDQMLERGTKMSSINSQMMNTGSLVFLPSEIREMCGFEPMEEEDLEEADLTADVEDPAEDPNNPGDDEQDSEDPIEDAEDEEEQDA